MPKSSVVEEFEGYRTGDVTYCVDPTTNAFFPVRVVNVARQFLDVEPVDPELADRVSPEFKAEESNRRFASPRLPPMSRFGGCDERTVNMDRASGPELRLLPVHYATVTGAEIRKLHQAEPECWPLPTGTIFERWFKDK